MNTAGNKSGARIPSEPRWRYEPGRLIHESARYSRHVATGALVRMVTGGTCDLGRNAAKRARRAAR